MPPLQVKYRPETLSEFIGNDNAVDMLSAILDRTAEDLPHTYLFTGPSGCGKTTLARIVAKHLKVSNLDLREMDSADFRGIDTIRSIRHNMHSMPFRGDYRMYILDECHQLTKDAQEALLKALEDTPPHVIFALCTTDPEKLKPTLKRRCTHIKLEAQSVGTILAGLDPVIKSEDVDIPEKVRKQIANQCSGSMGIALGLLDKIIESDPEDMLTGIENTEREEKQVIDLCRILCKKAKWAEVAKILTSLKEQNAEPERIRQAAIAYCSNTLLKTENPRAALVLNTFIDLGPFYNNGFADVTNACYVALFE